MSSRVVISRLFEIQLGRAQIVLLDAVAKSVADGSRVDSVLFWRVVVRAVFTPASVLNDFSANFPYAHSLTEL